MKFNLSIKKESRKIKTEKIALYLVFSGYSRLWITNNILENYYLSRYFSYSVLTDQQSQVQATNKVYHK